MDAKGRAARLRALAWNWDRATMRKTLQEHDVTICLAKYEVRALRAAIARLQFTKGE
jgi:hypothetical protein